MKILIIPLVVCVIFACFLIYEVYQYRKEYQVVKKFSINTGEGLEYYFVLQRKSDNKSFKIKVNKDVYDSCNNDDYIII